MLKSPQVFACGSSTSAVSSLPVQTSLTQWTRVSLFEKSLHCSYLILPPIVLFSHSSNSSLSLMLQYVDLHTSYFPHLPPCTFMQNLPICQFCASGSAAMHFLNQFSVASHKGCCLDVTRTNIPVFSDP